MDLSAYISFLVKADISDIAAPVFVLTDNSVYPAGIVPTGIFTVTQPDGLTRTGKFDTPDISGTTTSKSIGLRLDCNNKLQNGTYTVKYEIEATGYDNTILTRSFTVNYTQPTLVLTNLFDLFTPSLEYQDDTNYAVSGFTSTVTRAWTATIGTVGALTGPNSVSFDLKYAGSYYDADYTVAFTSNITYQSTSYSYFSIVDKLTKTVNADAYTPPTSAQLLTYLTTLKTRLDALINSCQKYDKAKADYEYAYTLYAHAMKRICNNDKVGVDSYITEIINIYNNNVSTTQIHTNAAIAPYVYDCGGSTVVVSQYSVAVVSGTAEAIAAGIIVGQTTFTNPLIASRNVMVNRGQKPLPKIDPLDGGMFYTKTYQSDTITFSAPIFDGEYYEINTI